MPCINTAEQAYLLQNNKASNLSIEALDSSDNISCKTSPKTPILTFQPINRNKGALAVKRRWAETGWVLLITYFFLVGAEELPSTATGLLVANDLKFQPYEESLYFACAWLPWTIRPLYAILAGMVPIGGYRWKPYFIIGSVLTCLFQALLALFGKTISTFFFLGISVQVFMSIAEVTADSLSIERGLQLAAAIRASPSVDGQPVADVRVVSSGYTQNSIQARVQSECYTFRTAGSLVAEACSVLMLRFLPSRDVLFWAAPVFVLAAISSLWYKHETRCDLKVATSIDVPSQTVINSPNSSQSQRQRDHSPEGEPLLYTTDQLEGPRLLAAVADESFIAIARTNDISSPDSEAKSTHPILIMLWSLKGPLLFILTFAMMPKADGAYDNYIASQFQDEFVSWQFGAFNFCGLTGGVIGCLIYQRYLSVSQWQLRSLFTITVALSTTVACSQLLLATRSNERILLIPDGYYLPLTKFWVSLTNAMAALPPLILSTHYASKCAGQEGTIYALFNSFSAVGTFTSGVLSAWLQIQIGLSRSDFSLLWQFMIVCSACSFLSLLIMPILLGRIENKFM